MFPFRRLAVWEKAHALTLRVYRATEGPQTRRFPGLQAQLRRAVAAIPTNISEGSGHASQAQFNRFLEIALASAREADYHLLLARDLEILSEREYAHLEARLSEVQGMLMGLRKRVLERLRENKRGERPRGENGKRGGRKASPLPSPISHLQEN
ncbi:MAG: four helix bundle protein [Gemmatimonadales bacterium]|nr:four helix bundle protein [Gemmatimonadales bacterium]